MPQKITINFPMTEFVQLCQKGEWGNFPEGFYFEPKLDGTRCLAGKVGDRVKLLSRHKTDYTDKFPEIVAGLKAYPYDFILDGEIICESYTALAGRTHLEDRFKIEMRAKVHPCDYCVFDVIAVDGARLDRFPLAERKKILYGLGERSHIKIVKPEPIEALLERVEGKEIEGVVAKDPNAPYEFRRSPSWIKFRQEICEDLLIIGFEDSDKPTRPYRSLILKRGEKEVKASSGLSEADLELTLRLFAKEQKHRVGGTKWYFEKPRFVAEIEFYGGSEIQYRFPRVVKLKLEK